MTKSSLLLITFVLFQWFCAFSMHGQQISVQFQIDGPDEIRTPASHLIHFEGSLYVGTGGMRVLEYDMDGNFVGTLIDMEGNDVGPWSNLYMDSGNIVGHGGEAGYNIFLSEHSIDGSMLVYENVTNGQSGTGDLIDVNGDWHLLWASNCCGTGQTWDTELKRFNGHSSTELWNLDLCYECDHWAGSCSHGSDYPESLEFWNNHLFAFKANVTSPCFSQIALQKIDLNGNLVWEKVFPGDSHHLKTTAVEDGILLLGHSGDYPNRTPFLWKLDSEGEIGWSYDLTTQNPDVLPVDMMVRSNGDLLVMVIESGVFRMDLLSAVGELLETQFLDVNHEIQFPESMNEIQHLGNHLVEIAENDFILAYNRGEWYDGTRFSLVRFSIGPIAGCLDETACNYNLNAEIDDESCDYTCCPGPGCCDVGMHWDWGLGMCQITNTADTNLDGCIQLNDLLDVLSAYGSCW